MMQPDQIDALVKEFFTLDSSLVHTIAADHDDPEDARFTLQALAQAAESAEPVTDSNEPSPESSHSSGGLHEDTESFTSLEDEDLKKATAATSALHLEDSSSEHLAFLTAMYSNKRRSQLMQLLAEQGNDVEKVIDLMLNIDFIASTPASTTNNSDAESISTPAHRKTKRKRQRADKGKQVISLTDPQRQTRSAPSSEVEDNSSHEPAGQHWVTVDSVSLHLASLLDLSAGQVTSAYYKHSSSFALALEALLDELSRTRPFHSLTINDGSDPALALTNLVSLFPSDKPANAAISWRRLLCGANGNVEHAIDLMTAKQDITGREGSAVSVSVRKGRDESALLRKSTAKEAVEAGLDSKDLPAWSISSASRLRATAGGAIKLSEAAKAPLIADPTRASPSECVAMAEDYRAKRNESFKAAARHFQAGKSSGHRGQGDRGAAGYWAERGRELDAKARVWDMRAARALVNQRRINAPAGAVDLHNLTVTQAMTVVRESVNSWWSSEPNPPPLRLITGVGKHSAHQTPVLLPAVSKQLAKEGWLYRRDDEEGVILVTGLKQNFETLR